MRYSQSPFEFGFGSFPLDVIPERLGQCFEPCAVGATTAASFDPADASKTRQRLLRHTQKPRTRAPLGGRAGTRRGIRRSILSLSLALSAGALTVSAPRPAAAVPLIFEMSGTLDAATGFDGTPFGSPLSFSLSAPFDSANGLAFPTGGFFPTSVTFTIAGEGTVTTTAAAAFVDLGDPNFLGDFLLGIVDHTVNFGVLGIYTTATPAISVFAPVPTVFSNFIRLDQVAGNFALTNGHALTSYEADAITSTSIVAAPEPDSLAVLIVGLIGAMLCRRNRLKL